MSQIILDSANDLIQGDFDNATLSQRTRLQTSTINATTGVYVVPNGTANSASVQISNAADPTNASKVVVATNGSTDTQIVSGANGSGTYLPLSFYTNNDIRFQIGNAGQLGVRTAPGTVSAGTSGQFLTSGGPAAGVSWTTVTVPPSGQIQTQVFTSPGTWTNPGTVTQVRVTVVGGGGGSGTPGNGAVGGSGGTSSFGPAVSATGGGGGCGSPVFEGSTGTGSLSSGTILRNGNVSFTTSDIIDGQASTDSSPKTYSPTSPFQAGGRGNSTNPATSGSGGRGGMIMALTPVSAPVSVTVGTGGAGALNPNGTSVGGVSGAVVVEWVG